MLGAMRNLALDYLFMQLGEGQSPPDDLDSWYLNLRKDSLEKLLQFLVEDTGKIEKIYIIRQAQNEEMVELEVQEMRPEIAKWLPFMKPSGSQGAQIGPIIKRTYSKEKGPGPSSKILKTTMAEFKHIAQANKPWSSYFREIVNILEYPSIKIENDSLDWKKKGYGSMLHCVVQEIGAIKGTVLITILDKRSNFPGQRQEYNEYLMEDRLAGDRYLTQGTQANKLDGFVKTSL